MGNPGGNGTKKSVSQRVLEYAITKVGHKAPGRGTCWDLPNEALKHAGASTPNDLGADLYIWGQRIERLEDAQPGDILQFEKVEIRTETRLTDGRTKYQTFSFAEKHSAIIERVNPGLFFTTLNAHIKGHHGKVVRLDLNLSPESIKSGRVFLYRPTERPRR